jgi:hypothetical protein
MLRGAAGTVISAPTGAATLTPRTPCAHCVLQPDETSVAMLKPGTGKAHRAFLWAYTPGAFEGIRAVIYDFADSRTGQNAQYFLGEWRGAIVRDDYSGYKSLRGKGVVEGGFMAHARRQFVAVHADNEIQIAYAGIQEFTRLCEIEREVKDSNADERRRTRHGTGRAPGASCLDGRSAAEVSGRFSDGEGVESEPEPLGRADALPARRQLA